MLHFVYILLKETLQKLHYMIINEDLQISNINEMDQATLVRICKDCGIKNNGKIKGNHVHRNIF